MARPAKSVKVKTGAIAGDEEALRGRVEEKLRGSPAELDPPGHLSDDQKDIFCFIVNELRESEILGSLDVAISRVRQINAMINGNDKLLMEASLQSTRAKYQADMWRGCSELCLSPQARAKIGSLAAQSIKQKEDPLMKAVNADDD